MIFNDLSGAPIVMLDDVEDEVLSIETVLKHREIEFEFIKLDIEDDRVLQVIPNLKLIFLDLHYGFKFDPELCAQYISKIVPEEKQYYLVIWSKDPQNGDEVLDLLKEYNLMPINYLFKDKSFYRQGDNQYNAIKLLEEIEREFDDATSIERFYGQVIDIEDDHILINCLIQESPSVFQVRRFDKELFRGYIDLKQGAFLSIIITTKPGSRVFEFFNEKGNLSEKFKRPDYFEDLGDVSFLNDEE